MHTNSINSSIYKEDNTSDIDNKDGYDKTILDTCFLDSGFFDQKENIIELFNKNNKLPDPSLIIKPIEPLKELEKLQKTINDNGKDEKKIMEKENKNKLNSSHSNISLSKENINNKISSSILKAKKQL